jgi:hypothetical protein
MKYVAERAVKSIFRAPIGKFVQLWSVAVEIKTGVERFMDIQ